MTNFPTSLDTLTNPTASDTLDSPSHSAQHANSNDAIEALEAKVGIDSSAVNTTHDFKLAGVSDGDKAVSLTGTETLTNKTLTSPTVNTPTITALNISDEEFSVSDNGDNTKEVDFELSGATTSTKTTIAASQTAARTLTLPDATDTLVGKATTDTLTNKTIDSANNTLTIDASEATVSNLDVADFAAAVIVTEGEGIASNDNDTTIPTSAAVRNYADSASSGTKIGISASDVTVSNSTSETNLLQESITGGVLGTSDAIKAIIHATNFELEDTDTCTIRLKYGSTTLTSLVITNNTGGNISGMKGSIEAYLVANGGTSSQDGFLKVSLFDPNLNVANTIDAPFVLDIGTGTATEDSTGALNFTISVQFSVAGAANLITSGAYIVEKIQA